eukprot:COSAG05_NODE_2416_length_3091_cov_4.257994_3_plen_72_part_00
MNSSSWTWLTLLVCVLMAVAQVEAILRLWLRAQDLPAPDASATADGCRPESAVGELGLVRACQLCHLADAA